MRLRFKKNLKNDAWRGAQVEKALSSKNHPFSKFSTGNVKTLRDEPLRLGLDIRNVVIDFYRKNYSSNLMKLVIETNLLVLKIILKLLKIRLLFHLQNG
jgi:secreted Zn-dependent insulinase-like peptidase